MKSSLADKSELIEMHQKAEEHKVEDWEAELFQMKIVQYQPPDPILAGGRVGDRRFNGDSD